MAILLNAGLSGLSLAALLGVGLIQGPGAIPAAPAGPAAAYDVFVPAPAAIEELVNKAGSQLAGLGLQSFYRKGYLPHVTLYLTRYSAARLPELRKRVQALAAAARSFELQASGCSLTPSHWLFLDVPVSPELQALSDAAVRSLSPLHDASLPEPAWLKDAPQKRQAFQKYGSPNVFSYFEPHLTQLAHEPSPKLSNWFQSGQCKSWQAKGRIQAIGLAQVDADGQILRGQAELYPIGR